MLTPIRRSLRIKVLGLVLATTFTALLFTGAVLLAHGLRQHRASWVHDLRTQAELVALASAPALAFHDTLAARQNVALLATRPAIHAAAIYGLGGTPVATYVRDGHPYTFPPVTEQSGHHVRGGLVELFQPITDPDERLGTVYVASRYAAPFATYVPVVLAGVLGSLLIALAMSSLLQQGVTRPILGIAEVARRVEAERDFSLRVPRTTEDETGELVDAFNDMLARVGDHASALEGTNRALEREMEVRHEAERALVDANRRKDEFLATLAHELRNPLAPIRNAIHYLRGKGPAAADDARMLELADRQIQHMVRLIEDLMDIARITRDALELRPSRFGLDALVGDIVDSCQVAIDSAGHRLVVRVPEGEITLLADRARLAQVVSNLLFNAAKYTPRGGSLELSAATAGRDLVVTVSDTGIGIPPDQLDRVFEPFAQLDRSLEMTGGGLGIGLALARRLVTLHGGTLTAASEGIGRGSTFRVTVPVVTSPALDASTADGATPATPPVRKARILVADDNADAAETLAAVLRTAGHDPATAHDGEEALALARGGGFDAAVLDIGMPRLNGYELARRIREQPWGRGMRLLALTGWGQNEDRERALEAGFDEHLTKPVHPQQLLAALAPAVDKPRR